MIPLPASALSDFFADSPLNIIYTLALFLGVMYSVFLLFFHGIGDALGDLDFDIDADVDFDVDGLDAGHNAAEATGVSTLAIASFISSFGAFGLLSVTMFDAGAVISMLAALFGGIVIGLAAQVFFLYILSPTISSEVRQAKLIGLVGEITTPIPANGVGQIALVAQGSRMTYSARTVEGDNAVSRGTPVRIERVVGGMAYVSELE